MELNMAGKTRLTEAQARSLAHWWGGDYRWTMDPEGQGEVWHGVVFGAQNRGEFSAPVTPGVVVFSLEEVCRLENFRDAVNPRAPDWVG